MNQIARKQEFDQIWNGAEQLEVLIFCLNGETFALEATIVQEILDLVPETRVPGSMAFVSSVINFRGKVIPLADIRLAFGMQPAEATIDSRIIVLEQVIEGEATLVGLKTDKVNEVTTLARASGEPPPSVGMRWRPDYIQCLVKRDSEFIIIPNLGEIFARKS
ncbi:chemotaxis protein CheW [Ensifer soli]|uniref:chemotaxis protein CheW n=1 Tax=Ciceribacter sp. sgz301302 TaxID=3342379 RepID=UPI0035B8364F